MVSLSFSSCNKDKDQKVSNSERLIGEWIYRTTQEKINGEWKDMPTQVGAEGTQTFYKDGKALITMTFEGEYKEQKFEWNLKDNNDYIINGTVRGQILFESNDCFYFYSDETFDPEAGENIKGEFRDIYDRKK